MIQIPKPSKWNTPFLKQCIVTASVSLNLSSNGVAVGFSAILLPQLRKPESNIPIDDSSGSWIASVLGIALVVGNFIVPSIMAKYGRKTASLISIVPMIIGWIVVITAPNIIALIIARLLQGISIGMASFLGPILIGEYTSPKNRGAFLSTIALAIGAGVLTVHTLGSYLTWQVTAMICTCIVLVDLVLIIYSPESPTWLADQGRYDECERIFRWLRGYGEEEELQNMIDASKILRNTKADIVELHSFVEKSKKLLQYLNSTLRKKEFYKPIIIMIHIHTLGQWAGSNVLASYAADIFHGVIGNGADVALMIVTLDIQRLISNTCVIFVIRRVKRRTMLFTTFAINLFALLSIAGYSYAKNHNLLPYDHPYIGIGLIHVHMFSIATGTLPIPYIIAGEVFPLEFKSLAGGISTIFLSLNIFITVKTMPFLFSTIGLHGAYLLYGGVVAFCLIVAGLFLPETKDRTLQDIEDDFRGTPLTPEVFVTAL